MDGGPSVLTVAMEHATGAAASRPWPKSTSFSAPAGVAQMPTPYLEMLFSRARDMMEHERLWYIASSVSIRSELALLESQASASRAALGPALTAREKAKAELTEADLLARHPAEELRSDVFIRLRREAEREHRIAAAEADYLRILANVHAVEVRLTQLRDTVQSRLSIARMRALRISAYLSARTATYWEALVHAHRDGRHLAPLLPHLIPRLPIWVVPEEQDSPDATPAPTADLTGIPPRSAAAPAATSRGPAHGALRDVRDLGRSNPRSRTRPPAAEPASTTPRLRTRPMDYRNRTNPPEGQMATQKTSPYLRTVNELAEIVAEFREIKNRPITPQPDIAAAEAKLHALIDSMLPNAVDAGTGHVFDELIDAYVAEWSAAGYRHHSPGPRRPGPCLRPARRAPSRPRGARVRRPATGAQRRRRARVGHPAPGR